MKSVTSLLLHSILLVFALNAHAMDFGSRVLLDKTYVRDNSYCRIAPKRYELEIRSFDQYTSFDEAEYGEHAFVIYNNNYKLLPLNEKMIGRYRFLKGKDKNCTKNLSLNIGKSGLIVFFLKDSRPFLDTLSMVHYDDVTKQIDVKETTLPVENAWVKNNVLHIYSYETLTNPDMGKIKINGQEHIYNQKPFGAIWTFDGKTFRVDDTETFNHFPFKSIIKTKEEFKRIFKWDSGKGNFTVKSFIYAVHMQARKECLKAENSEEWVCSKN